LYIARDLHKGAHVEDVAAAQQRDETGKHLTRRYADMLLVGQHTQLVLNQHKDVAVQSTET
jgi:hypothetical protein